MEDQAVEATVRQFVQGADEQNVEQVANVLSSKAEQFYMGPDGLVNLPTLNYLQLLQEKQIGGTKRQLAIEQVSITDTIATAKVVIDSEKVRFDNYFSLMKIEEKWQILSIVLKRTSHDTENQNARRG